MAILKLFILVRFGNIASNLPVSIFLKFSDFVARVGVCGGMRWMLFGSLFVWLILDNSLSHCLMIFKRSRDRVMEGQDVTYMHTHFFLAYM